MLGPLMGSQLQENFPFYLNPILRTTWLKDHAMTLKKNTAKYYFDEKSKFF